MAGRRARDTSPAKPISELSKHGMLLRSISGPSRSLANRLTEERVPLGGAEGGASEIRLVADPCLSATRDQSVNDPSTNPAAVLGPRLEHSRADRKIAAAGGLLSLR